MAAFKNISVLHDIETPLRALHIILSRLYVRKGQLEGLATVTECDELAF
jgi:hypothetical protein